MKKCIIIGAGDFTLPEGICAEDFVIAADGGYDHARAACIEPSIFVGDMDSLTTLLPENIEKITFPARKDYTDMHLSYLEGDSVKQKMKQHSAVAIVGKRNDKMEKETYTGYYFINI